MRTLHANNGRQGGILFGLLVSALVIVCLMIATGLYIARNVSVESRSRTGGADVSIDTPAGHLTVRAHETPGTAATGVPLYPGARNEKGSGGDAVVQWTTNAGEDKGVSISAADLVTSDPAEKVVEYYRGLSPKWMIVHRRDGETRLEMAEGGYKRMIAIRERGDGTHIAVASTGEPASN